MLSFSVTPYFYIKSPRFVFKYFYRDDKVKLSALFIALCRCWLPVIHAQTTSSPVLENRAAQGVDITMTAGAPFNGDQQTEALRASLIISRRKYYFAHWRWHG